MGGRTRGPIGMILTIGLLAAGCGGGSNPFEAKGEGPGGSAAIDLVAGNYVLAWSAEPISGASCAHRAALETTDELVIKPLMNETVTSPVKDRQLTLSQVPAGHYYIDVNSDCRWTFLVKPAG
jgi:hypothetical protein